MQNMPSLANSVINNPISKMFGKIKSSFAQTEQNVDSVYRTATIAQLTNACQQPTSTATSSNLKFYIAHDAQTIKEIQQFRAWVFSSDYHIYFENNIDVDEYDAYSIHVYVRDEAKTHKPIVACTRIVTPKAKQVCGQYYSEQEFNLNHYLKNKTDVYEIGRTSVEPSYRRGKALACLWRGMIPLVFKEIKAKYLIGTVSVNLNACSKKRIAAEQFILENTNLAAIPSLRLYPHQQNTEASCLYILNKFPKNLSNTKINYARKDVPSLVKKYADMGAIFSTECYWDEEFNSLDYFVGIKVSRMLVLKVSLLCKVLDMKHHAKKPILH